MKTINELIDFSRLLKLYWECTFSVCILLSIKKTHPIYDGVSNYVHFQN